MVLRVELDHEYVDTNDLHHRSTNGGWNDLRSLAKRRPSSPEVAIIGHHIATNSMWLAASLRALELNLRTRSIVSVPSMPCPTDVITAS